VKQEPSVQVGPLDSGSSSLDSGALVTGTLVAEFSVGAAGAGAVAPPQ
jgi:hypothetical protein